MNIWIKPGLYSLLASHKASPISQTYKTERLLSMRQVIGILILSITVTNSSARESIHSPAKHYEIVDIMPRFWKFYNNHKTFDDKTVQLFRKEVIEPDKDIYAMVPGDLNDERIKKYLTDLAPLATKMQALGKQFPSLLKKSWNAFEKMFPDISGKTKLIMMPSFNSFNGMSRTMNGNAALLFGMDRTAADNDPDFNFIPQIQHEIAHLYHAQKAPGILKNFAFYNNLWQEGLAVYITKKLNPNATDQEIFLSDSMRRLVTPAIPRLAKEMRKILNVEPWEEKAKFLSAGAQSKEYPERSAYFIGELIAEEFTKKYTLNEMVTLEGNRLSEEVDRVLKNFEASMIK